MAFSQALGHTRGAYQITQLRCIGVGRGGGTEERAGEGQGRKETRLPNKTLRQMERGCMSRCIAELGVRRRARCRGAAASRRRPPPHMPPGQKQDPVCSDGVCPLTPTTSPRYCDYHNSSSYEASNRRYLPQHDGICEDNCHALVNIAADNMFLIRAPGDWISGAARGFFFFSEKES